MDEMKTGTVIKSEDNAIFIKNTASYFQLKKTTQLNLNTETETEEKKFIADKNTTIFNKNTKISLENDLYTIKGEPDFEYFFPIYTKLVKEQPAMQDILVVFKCMGDSSAGYTAWHFPSATLMFTGYDAQNSTLNFTFNFGEGELGKVTMSDSTPTFAKDEE